MMIEKWLTVIGLVLEFSSIYSTIKEIFLTKERYIDELGKSDKGKIEERRKKSQRNVGLLAIGMLLQGIALFV